MDVISTNLRQMSSRHVHTNAMRKTVSGGINAQIRAALRKDISFPKKNTKDAPIAYAMPADAVSVPRTDGSLYSIHATNEKM